MLKAMQASVLAMLCCQREWRNPGRRKTETPSNVKACDNCLRKTSITKQVSNGYKKLSCLESKDHL